MGDDDQLDSYLRRALECGLTRSQNHRGFDPRELLRRLNWGDRSDVGCDEDARQVATISRPFVAGPPTGSTVRCSPRVVAIE